jgi:hypothetical protein
MDRRRLTMPGLLALTTLGLTACSSPPEQPILNQFFTASRLLDYSSLDNFATVMFEPRTHGTVMSFTITSVTPEQHKVLNIKALAQAQDEAKAADAAYTKRKQDYESENREAVRRVLKAERENATLKGNDAEVQAAWVKFREEGVSISRRISEARTRLASESSIVELSVSSDPRNAVDLKKYDGELVSKDVTVSATVRLPTTQTAQRTLVVTMERAVLHGDKSITGRWIITNIKDPASAAAIKTS